ncbi:carbohydrate ABC transporter permease [Paenibacillus aurantius]|uniref:Carbohydrate ABC transporter permease n=1 Tax=Paenibacillus aurantius TaxID=2918900 RepID=A0AA96LH94_9BACL|nr:carbohydrate ABC transporter permease [Paenibacillus aurantius]WNQ13260.1 carbohydrate ABC transporter permease [Paenibacillus aurantius]
MRLAKWGSDLLLYALAIFFLFPLYWMITGSFKSQSITIKMPPELIPYQPVLTNYKSLMKSSAVFDWLINSVLVAGLATVFTCLIATMAGYALTKKRFAGRGLIFGAIIATMMVPRQLGLVPMFILMRDLHLVNHLASVILPTLALPFGVFLMRQFSLTVPNELLEAGRMDGCSEIGLFTRIFLPYVQPGIGALAIFIFSFSWNDYLWQLVMLSDTHKMTINVGISTLISEFNANYGMQMAGATLGFIPVLAMFLMFQKYFVRGITVGGVKG